MTVEPGVLAPALVFFTMAYTRTPPLGSGWVFLFCLNSAIQAIPCSRYTRILGLPESRVYLHPRDKGALVPRIICTRIRGLPEFAGLVCLVHAVNRIACLC